MLVFVAGPPLEWKGGTGRFECGIRVKSEHRKPSTVFLQVALGTQAPSLRFYEFHQWCAKRLQLPSAVRLLVR